MITETRTIEVEVTREEMLVERLSLSEGTGHHPQHVADPTEGPLTERLRALQLGETLRLPIVEEEVVIQKRPIITGEVTVGKRLVEEVRTFSDMVRRQDARITEKHATGDHRATTRVEANLTSAPAEQPLSGRLDEAGERTIELQEEELSTRTRVVEVGAVEVRIGVVHEQQSVVLKLEHEETDVELRAVDHRPADRAVGSGEDVLDIPEYGEQVSFRKRPVVMEEITVSKESVEEVKQVTATLRREEAHVETRGDVRLP